MKIELFETLGGDFTIGDSEDEGSPLMKITFHNEFKNIKPEIKKRLGRLVVDQLWFLGHSQ